MNWRAVWAIYRNEMNRFFRTMYQSIVSPVISTALYFVVFGTAIGSRIPTIEGVSYAAFIVPGLIMLSLIMQGTSNASFGIYRPRFVGAIYELLAAPISFLEVVLGFVGAAASKAMFIGAIILLTSTFFVELHFAHPLAILAFFVLTAVTFSLFGFVIGIWADSFEQVNLIPGLVLTPLVFLGGTFYSISMLPPAWQVISMFNPVVYLISGFRWAFFGYADVPVLASLAAIAGFLALCLTIVWIIFRTGWRLRK
ncbi:ABC transporter permease [Ketogulonicigenium vulgare]|nr:ABC transporter permease [Ketogulonicigenium vulgare]ALJ82230.1 sugar ABC transporter permease [Ketogulonicigenium vulgare]ANW34884.1 sugar ABC transporter permease [Ketogulonicigenium vulgare]